MDFWMIDRKELQNDLLDIFSALGDLQYQYNWVITDHDLWYAENCPDEVKKRWQWTGLLIDGQELTEHLATGYVRFLVGGVLSAVSRRIRLNQVWNYEPYWEHKKLFSADYHFQTPLTQMELICYDGYAWLIVCDSNFSKKLCQALPQAKSPKEFYNKS